MAFLLPIVGYAFFGPWGALIGGLLQSIFFKPEGPKGPRLNELNVQHSTVGAPVPIVYGTAALAGNVIWSGGLIETKHEDEQGGKFGIGGTKVTSYTYSVDVAVGICEGPISGIRRIWADADLIYDGSDDETLFRRIMDADTPEEIQEGLQEFIDIIYGIRAMSAQLNFELYLGTDDQLPDPTIQSYENEGYVGNVVPAYRGLAYIVFNDFQLEKWGNRIPNFRFEITSNGTDIECGVYTGGQLYPWLYDPAVGAQFDGATADPRNPQNQHLYRDCISTFASGNTTLLAAKASMSTAYSGRDFLVSAALGKEYADNIYIQGWALSSTPNRIRPCDDYGTGLGFADYRTVALMVNSVHQTILERYQCPEVGQGDVPFTGQDGGTDCQNFFNYNTRSLHQGDSSGFFVKLDEVPLTDPAPFFDGTTVAQGTDSRGDCAAYEPEPRQKWALFDQEMCVTRSIQPPDTWAVTWTEVSGTFKVLHKYQHDGGNVILQYPLDPSIKSDSIFYNDQAFWEAAHAEALASGVYGGTSGLSESDVYGVDYPQVISVPNSMQQVWRADCTAVEVACVPMSEIVTDICRRAGLRTDSSAQIDVSDLTTCVQGYIIGRQMSARDALGPLRMFGLWDAVESDALLKFVERGHALVDSLTEDDLGVHEAGSQAPPAMEVSRVQEKELPRRVRLHFANFLHDHEASEQSASRLATEAVDELDVEMPISMEPDTAKQLAEIMLYEAYVSRNAHRFALDNNWLALEPTDCIEIPVDGQTERVRIVSVDYSIGGILKIDALRDDDGSYVSTAIATPGAPSGGVPGGPGSGPICPSGLVLLDLPCLNDSHSIDAGYYAAIYSTCPEMNSWACAELYRSNDGGVTFGRVARTNDETTVGEIETITGPATDPTLPGDSPPYDTSNSITVTLFVGELESITDAQIDAGQNMAAVGQDGQWVIIQFKTAVLDTGNTWVLTDLIWGLNDTQHLLGTTSNGDTFVLLSDSALLRIPESPDAIGQSKEFKVVTCGEAVDAVTAVDFTTWGLCYQRPCPSTVLSASTTEPPEDADDGDAYLLPNDTSLSGVWANHGGEIAKWSDETDSWVYCTPVPGTIIHVIDVDEDTSTSGGGGDVIIDEDGNTTPAPWARSDESYLTRDDERARLPNSLPLIAGDNITFEQDTSGLIIHGSAAGFDTSDTSDIGIALDELTDVVIGSPLAEGDILVYRGTEGWVNEPVETAFPGIGGGAMSFVDEYIVAGSNATDLPFTGLDLDADDCYYLQIDAIGSAAGGAFNLLLYLNGDTASTNYERVLTTDGASAVASDNSIFGALGNNEIARWDLWITRNGSGRIIASVSGARINATVLLTQSGGVIYDVSANLTSLTIHSDIANTFAIGTRARLWKLTRTITTGDTGGGGGFPDATYLTENDETADLPNSRMLLAGTAISFDDTTPGERTISSTASSAIPLNTQTGNYTLVIGDAGYCIYRDSGSAATWTIPANGSVAFAVGTVVMFNNRDADTDIVIAITTDTLVYSPGGATGSRTLVPYGRAFAHKLTSTVWEISGTGLF